MVLLAKLLMLQARYLLFDFLYFVLQVVLSLLGVPSGWDRSISQERGMRFLDDTAFIVEPGVVETGLFGSVDDSQGQFALAWGIGGVRNHLLQIFEAVVVAKPSAANRRAHNRNRTIITASVLQNRNSFMSPNSFDMLGSIKGFFQYSFSTLVCFISWIGDRAGSSLSSFSFRGWRGCLADSSDNFRKEH